MIEINENSLDAVGPIAHYQLQRLLARGGMSNIYLAYDTEEQRTVAIKLVHSDDSDYCTRFQREVKAIAQLHHDHILPAFDYGEQGEWCYMVMPYIEGGTLSHRLEQGPLTPKEASSFFTQLTDAVQFAHEHNVLHRDIKPSNMLLRDGDHLYLTDFGLVRHIGEDSNITSTGYIIGTPEYIAPEQIEHSAIKSSDIYALGIVLYQMLTGRVPFKGSTPIGTCWKHLNEEPVPPSTLNPQISQAVEAVVLRALAKEPRRRYQSAHEFALAYQNALKEESLSSAGTLALSIGVMHPGTAKRTRPAMLALAALLMLFIMPMSLGFVLSRTYSSTWYTQAPTLLGASGSFFKGQITGKPPVHTTTTAKPTASDTPTSNTLSRYRPAPVPTETSPSTNSEPKENGSSQNVNNGHGHSGGNKNNNSQNNNSQNNNSQNSNSHGNKNKGGKGNGQGGNNDGGDNNNSLQNTVTLS